MTENSTFCKLTLSEAQFPIYIGTTMSGLVTCESVLTIATIHRSPTLHESQYLVIASLAILDIVTSITCTAGVHVLISCLHSDPSTITFAILCFGSVFASISVTGVHMSIIAVDRYIRIAHPFYYINKMTKQRMLKILVCAWTLWILLMCSFLIDRDEIEHWKYQQLHTPLNYYIVFICVVMVCVAVVCFCYCRIAQIAVNHKQAAIARRLQNGIHSGTTGPRSSNITLKSIKFFVAMFGVYFTCAAIPFIVAGVTLVHDVAAIVIVLVWFLFPAHSVLNFFIFCVMDQRFLRALKMNMTNVRDYCSFICCRN